jgi:hypothetical protein
VESLSENFDQIGKNLALFTDPENLNNILSIREAAKYISMPLSRSTAEIERARLIVRIDALLDDDMRKMGYNVKLKRESINLDDFNAFSRVRIDELSLTGESGKMLQERWQTQVEENVKQDFTPADYMRWSYSITALLVLKRAGIDMEEDLKQNLERLPEVNDLGVIIITPDMLKMFNEDRDFRRLTSHIQIKKIYPEVRGKDISFPLSIPFIPLNIFLKETSIKGTSNK